MIYYDIERAERLSEQPWFNCAKCGKEVRESEWASLCQDCGEQEEDFAGTPHPSAHYERADL
jgi:hypothetical protein